jgi:hypothetical protein
MGKQQATQQQVHAIADVPPKQLEVRVEKILQHLDAIDALLPDAVTLTAPERRSATRLQGAGEVTALSGVLAFAAQKQELFVALADEDEGVDPSTFETALLSDRLTNAQTMASLAQRISALHTKVADSALYTTGLVKPVALKAWEIAKVYRTHYAKEGVLLAPAFDFYSGRAITAAKTRAKDKAAESAPATGSTTPGTDGSSTK